MGEIIKFLERLYNILLAASQVSTHWLKRFVLVLYLCMTWMKCKGRKEIYHWIIRWWKLQHEKNPSCHLVHSLDSKEHEFSLTVRAFSNIQDKLPSSLLHTIPHIYNSCTILNRVFSISSGCLQWLSHFVSSLFVTYPSCTRLGLSISCKKTPFCLIKENSHSSDTKNVKTCQIGIVNKKGPPCCSWCNYLGKCPDLKFQGWQNFFFFFLVSPLPPLRLKLGLSLAGKSYFTALVSLFEWSASS